MNGAVQNRGYTTAVILVEVGEHEQIDLLDAQQIQARLQCLGVRSRIGERNVLVGFQKDGVSLPHVARGNIPLCRNGQRSGDPCGGVYSESGENYACNHRRERLSHPAFPRVQQPYGGHRDCRSAGKPCRTVGAAQHPRVRAQLLRDRGDPRRRQPGKPRQRLSERWQKSPSESREQAKHRGGHRRGRREKVRHHRRERNIGRDEGKDGLAPELSRDRDRDRVGKKVGENAHQLSRDRWSRDNKPGGRCHRKKETNLVHEPRVGEQKDKHGKAQDGDSRTRPADQSRQRHNDTHGGGANHAGTGGDQDNKARERSQRDHRACDASSAAPLDECSRRAHHNDAVGARHRRQVTQTGQRHRPL